jgi:hypothetical protein
MKKSKGLSHKFIVWRAFKKLEELDGKRPTLERLSRYCGLSKVDTQSALSQLSGCKVRDDAEFDYDEPQELTEIINDDHEQYSTIFNNPFDDN